MKEYAVFVEDIKKELVEGKEIVLTVKDLTPGPAKYENRVVKAVVSSTPGTLAGADVLRVRSWTGVLYPEPWAIKIVEEMGELLSGVSHGETLNVL